jgi:carbamoylphosphate synthase large subunit
MTNGAALHVLVLTADWQSALACIQSFGRKGHKVSIIPSKAPHPNYGSVFVRKLLALEQRQLDERARELMGLAEQNGIDLVVPISDHDALLVARAKELFPSSNALIGSSLAAVAITRSRNRTTELCRGLGIDTPRTIFVTAENAKASARELGYPCFLKISGTIASQGVFEIASEAELGEKLALATNKEMQLQAKVTGDFVDITGFALKGRVVESFAFRSDYVHSRAGTPAYSYRVRDERLDAMLAKIAHALQWTGGIDLDLLQRQDGSLVLLEINPRLSGTTVFAIKCGVDLPMYYVNAKLAIAGTPEFKPSVKNAERFASLVEENHWLKDAGEAGRLFSAKFRADDKWVDNAFWDDRGYSEALFEYARRSLIYAKKNGKRA